MIVKNEATNLSRCLESLSNLRSHIDSELIIVDTGSTDETIDIAKKYTDKVYYHEWNNNFSNMRNISISYATGKWLFVIDADEEVVGDEGIIEFFNSESNFTDYKSLSMNVRNFTNVNSNKDYSDLSSVRFYQNDGEFHFESAIHNIPIFKYPVGIISGVIYHYGYMQNDPVLMEKKFLRTSQLLRELLEKDPKNIYYRYQLSVSYAMYKHWEKAEEEIELAYLQVKDLTKDQKDLYFYVYGQLMMVYKRFEAYDKLLNICNEALEVRNDFIDGYFFLADAYICLGLKLEAIPFLRKYLTLVKKHELQEIHFGFDIKLETIGFKDKALFNLLIISYEVNAFDNVMQYFLEFKELVKEKKTYEKIIRLPIKAATSFDNYVFLAQLYRLTPNEFLTCLVRQLEAEYVLLDESSQKKFSDVFANEGTTYEEFNRVRKELLFGVVDNNELIDLNKWNNTEKETYYSDLFFQQYYRKKDVMSFVKWLVDNGYESSLEVINRLDNGYAHFMDWIMSYIEFNRAQSLSEITLRCTIEKYYLYKFGHEGQSELALDLFKFYIQEKYQQLCGIFLEEAIINESYWLALDEEVRLIFLLHRAMTVDVSESFAYLKKALKISGDFKPYIIILTKEVIETAKTSDSGYNGGQIF